MAPQTLRPAPSPLYAPRWVLTLPVAVATYALLHWLWLIVAPAGISLPAGLVPVPPEIAVAVLCWRAAGTATGSRSIAWMLFALAYLADATANLLWATFLPGQLLQPLSHLGDVTFLGAYPLMLGGLLLTTPRRLLRSPAFWLDSAMVAVGSAMLLWYVAALPTASTSLVASFTTLLALVYPIAVALLIAGVAAVMLRQAAARERRSVVLLTIAAGLLGAASIAYGYLTLAGVYSNGSWSDAFWTTAMALSAAVVAWHGHAPAPIQPAGEPHRLTPLPYLVTAGGFALLLAAVLDVRINSYLLLNLGAMALSGLLIARQLMALRVQARALDARARVEAALFAEQRRQLTARHRRTIGALAEGLAHDLNNLLMAISGNAELALLDTPATSPARGSLRAILAGVGRAADLTAQLLAYGEHGPARLACLSLNPLVRDVADQLRGAAPERVSFRYQLAPGLPALEGDEVQLRQALLTLALHAAEALGERGGTVTLTTSAVELAGQPAESAHGSRAEGQPADESLPAGRYLQLTVSDTGSPAAGATLATLFEPYANRGGLGLAAAAGIVRGHGGAISVHGMPGQGTTVTVLLPARG